MTERLTRLATGLTGAALTLLLLAGPPWLLTTYVGPPIPTSWPNLDTVREITAVGVTDTFVITTVAVVVWAAWVQLAIAILIELLAAIRRRPAWRLPVLPGAQPLAARLVAATLLLVTAVQPRPIAAAPLELAAVTTVPIDQATAAPERPADVATTSAIQSATMSVTVAERDSWWTLAETHLGDGLRWREIREVNTGRTLADGTTITTGTDLLQPGWTLLVPATDTQRHHPAGEHLDAADEQAEEAEQWEVEDGEHFWHIAKTTLEDAWERAPTDTEIVGYWHEVIETNRDRLAPPGDPDLIHPGQRFELPPPPNDPHAPALAPNTAPDPTDPPPEVEVHSDVEEPAEQTPLDSPDTDRLDSATPDTSDAPPAAAEPRDPDPPAEQDQDRDTSSDDRGGLTPLGVSRQAAPAAIAATLAAAGIVALIRRRRDTLAHQRLPGYRLPTPAPDVDDHLATLTHVAPDDAVLEDLTALLATIPADVTPPLVVLHDHGPVSIIVGDTDIDPPAPWTPDPGQPGEPIRWTAQIGNRGPSRSIGLPLLVTLGHTGTSSILANLGALSNLTVHGAADEVRTRLRAMTLELATSRTAGPLEVTVCDDEQFTDLDQIRPGTDPNDALAATLADVEQDIIDDDRLPRAVICHTPSGIEIPAAARRFCALICAGDITTGTWGLRIDGDHGWLHIPDVGEQPLTLPGLDPTLIAQELDSLADNEPPTQVSDDPTPSPAHVQTSGPAYCEVCILGPVTVTVDQTPLDSLSPISRQLLTYLATHRDHVTVDQLDTAIWPDRPPSRGGQRARTALTRLRASLGDDPDGQPLLARRVNAEDPVTLSGEVGTDLDRALALLAGAHRTDDPAQAADLQAAALALIRGRPFADLTVSWSIDIEQRAIAQLQDAALTLAEHLSADGDHDRALWAIEKGLKLCDPTEPLYVAWAHIEQARGRADRIPHLWRRLCRLYADDADEIAGVMTTPTTETELAFTQLMADA